MSVIERYCAVDIVKTLSINEATASFDEVKTALNGCFAACRNAIVERAQFNRQRQNPSESMDTFIQDLHCLAKNCEYRTLRDDRIIIGVLDDTLSDRLQAKSDLTFTDAAHMRIERHITLHPEAKPFCLYNPRKIPHPLIAKVKSQIETMLQQGVILPVTVPTERCAGIVSVLRPNGSVHICVDLTHLNKAVQHEIHPMPSVDENLAKLGDRKIFSKLNANSGFWQIPLDDKLKLLTTFVTPFGCYCFNRLPFRISSAQRSPNALKGHSVRRITSSFMGWASRNMMNTYKLFFTTYKLG